MSRRFTEDEGRQGLALAAERDHAARVEATLTLAVTISLPLAVRFPRAGHPMGAGDPVADAVGTDRVVFPARWRTDPAGGSG